MSDPEIFIVGGAKRGRPPKAGVRAGQIVRVRTTEEQKAGLRSVAKAERRSMADVIRDAIDSYVGDFGERVIFTPSADRFQKPTAE